MKILLVLTLVLSALWPGQGAHAAMRPWASPFTFEEFHWRGQRISNWEELYQVVRTVKTDRDVQDLLSTMKSRHLDTEFILGYVIGEFEDRREQDEYIKRFHAVHPIGGTSEEVRSQPTSFFVALGYLFVSGLSAEDMKAVRAVGRGITELQAQKFFSRVQALAKPTRDAVLEILQDEMSDCGSKLN
jgi:hypothetical protein